MSDSAERTGQSRIEMVSSDGTITLRQLVPADAEDYFALIAAHPAHHSQYGDDTAKKYRSVDDVRWSIETPRPNKLRFGIYVDGQMVGSNNLTLLGPNRAETGSWIGRDYTGHNYASRAREPLLRIAFERLRIDEIVSRIHPDNAASRKSVERSGYTKDFEDETVCEYILTRTQWQATQQLERDADEYWTTELPEA